VRSAFSGSEVGHAIAAMKRQPNGPLFGRWPQRVAQKLDPEASVLRNDSARPEARNEDGSRTTTLLTRWALPCAIPSVVLIEGAIP
jgi:hypothetical protein